MSEFSRLSFTYKRYGEDGNSVEEEVEFDGSAFEGSQPWANVRLTGSVDGKRVEALKELLELLQRFIED